MLDLPINYSMNVILPIHKSQDCFVTLHTIILTLTEKYMFIDGKKSALYRLWPYRGVAFKRPFVSNK